MRIDGFYAGLAGICVLAFITVARTPAFLHAAPEIPPPPPAAAPAQPAATGAPAAAAGAPAGPAAQPVPVVTNAAFEPPARSAIPSGPLGDMIRQGEAIFRHTGKEAPQFVGNTLTCSNCHLDAGRLRDAAPMWAAWVVFPLYRSKNKHVNTFQERMQGCFRFSMNGKAPPIGDRTLVALETYSAWLAKGAPTGAKMPGRGYPVVPAPAKAPDFARGQAVYAANCSLCHGAAGQGQSAGGQVVFPPLWGDHSYNWGAGMTSVASAAGFVKANMPLGRGGSLSDQDAWDVAMFLDGQDRPQDPRFVGSVAETRSRFHDSKWSMYGQTVNGHLLGSASPPAGGTTR